MEIKTERVMPDGTTVYVVVPRFVGYRPPIGTIENELACDALMYYALCGRHLYEEHVQGRALEYEDSPSVTVQFRELFTHVAWLYNVSPDQMVKHWHCVQMQFTILRLPMLPDEARYRFNDRLIVH